MEENYLLAKWLNDEITDAELKEFKLNDDYHLYEKIKNYSASLETSSFNENELLSPILSSKKSTTKVIPFYNNWFVKIAAILVLAFGLLFTFNTFSKEEFIAKNGEKNNFLLPDNSQVFLNSGSQIEYKNWNWKDNRTLSLTGEAYFKVAKGKKFEVKTSLGKVTVLGTQFNVKARKNRFDISCFEGKVKVNYNNKEIILTKGKTVSFENNNKIIDKNITNTNPFWQNNEMAFQYDKIDTIVEEIQRNYAVTIDFSKIKSDQLFTGKIPMNDINVALKIIASSYHLQFKKVSNSNYIFEKSK